MFKRISSMAECTVPSQFKHIVSEILVFSFNLSQFKLKGDPFQWSLRIWKIYKDLKFVLEDPVSQVYIRIPNACP